MFYIGCVLIKLTLITCVVGIINVDGINKNGTEIKLSSFEGNNNQVLDSNTLGTLIENYINGKVYEATKKTEKSLEEKIIQISNATNKKLTETLDALDDVKKELLAKINLMSLLPCRELPIINNDNTAPISIDDQTLNYFTTKRNSTGHLTYFETHVAVQADEHVLIRLANKESFTESDKVYDIELGREGNQYTRLDFWYEPTSWNTVESIHTPNILSSSQFRAFYIKIDNGKLTFGKEGDSPLITHNDYYLAELKYFLFRSYSTKQTRIRYDCPAPVQGSA